MAATGCPAELGLRSDRPGPDVHRRLAAATADSLASHGSVTIKNSGSERPERVDSISSLGRPSTVELLAACGVPEQIVSRSSSKSGGDDAILLENLLCDVDAQPDVLAEMNATEYERQILGGFGLVNAPTDAFT